MVRLMLVLAPVMCILSGIAVSSILSTYMKNLDLFDTAKTKKAKRHDPSYPVKNEIASFIVAMVTFFLVTYTFHCTWVTSEAYSSPSIVLAASQHDGSRIIFDDFREVHVPQASSFFGSTPSPSLPPSSLPPGLLLAPPEHSRGFQGDVMVGLRLPDHCHGQSDYSSGQQHMEQYSHLSCWAGELLWKWYPSNTAKVANSLSLLLYRHVPKW